MMLAALGLMGCLPGPGRDVVFPDAMADIRELGVPDLGTAPDAGRFQAGDVPVGVTDFGTRPRFPFTGVFSAFGTNGNLLAREIDGRLAVVIETAPYVYVGTIDPEGRVDARSPVQERGGCPEATLKGQYGRFDATLVLQHRTCNARGELVTLSLQGGFLTDFVPALSGVYAGRVEALVDAFGCAQGVAPSPLRWGVNILSDGRALVVTLFDPIEEPFVYLGRLSNGTLALLAPVASRAEAQGVAFQGALAPAAAGQRAGLSGRRDVWRPVGGGCTFSMDVKLSRVDSP